VGEVGRPEVWLKASVEDLLMESFLPKMWVDLRGR
jgi:hypothetical protein